MQRFNLDGWLCWFRLGLVAESPDRPLKKLIFPLLYLVRVHVKLLGSFH